MRIACLDLAILDVVCILSSISIRVHLNTEEDSSPKHWCICQLSVTVRCRSAAPSSDDVIRSGHLRRDMSKSMVGFAVKLHGSPFLMFRYSLPLRPSYILLGLMKLVPAAMLRFETETKGHEPLNIS